MSDDLDHRLSRLRGRVQTDWSETRAERVLLDLEKRSARRRQSRRAAMGLLICGLLLVAPLLLRGRLQALFSDQEVAVALRLPDGSVATALSPDAELKAIAPQPGRTVLQLMRGSARFQVQPDPNRVFRVESGRVAVEVLGTEFTVTRRAEHTEVAVARGRVRVLWDSHYTELGAGSAGSFPPESADSARPPALPPSSVSVIGSADGDRSAGDLGAAPSVADAGAAPALLPAARPRALPSAPRVYAERPQGPSAPTGGDLWRRLAQQGQFDQAYRVLEAGDLLAASTSPEDLLLIADIARLSNHPAQAIAPLEKLLRTHRGDSRAALCAFTLGRVLLEDLGKPRQAAAAFREAQSLDPGFAMIEDALAREVKALWQAGDPVAAHDRAVEYLRRFPEGRSARLVRRFGAID